MNLIMAHINHENMAEILSSIVHYVHIIIESEKIVLNLCCDCSSPGTPQVDIDPD